MELDQVAKLKRYFFLGKLIPVYSPRKADKLIEDLELIKTLLLDVDGDSFITLVKSVTQREEIHLPRRNEVWFAYAVYISTCERVEDRKKVYQAFPELARNAEDMFTIVHYASMIQKKKNSKGHSRTMRKALKLWYETRTEAELIGMLEKNRGMYGYTHKDLIASSHINLEKVGLGSLYRAIFKSASKALEDKETETVKFESTENQEKLKHILEMKTCKDAAQAGELIEAHGLAIECVPTTLLRKFEVWEALIPQLNYQELLRYLFPLVDARLVGHRSLSTQLLKAIGNVPAMTKSGVSPVAMLILSKKLQTLKRYSEKKKALHYAEKVKRRNIKDNPLFGFKVNSMFKTSFDHVKSKTGLKFCILMNLQNNYETKPVINQKQVFCTDAAIALALTYFRSEPHVDVFTFTPMHFTVEKLAWTQGISFDAAQVICKAKQTPKNVQRLGVPLIHASKQDMDYDVFLFIVPSGTLHIPSHKPDYLIAHLNSFRTSRKKEKTRLIVVNLRRYRPSMIHDTTKIHDNGILEICGFGEETINIINAYATHSFS